MTDSYRRRFEGASDAAAYDREQYSVSGYPALLWDVERRLLTDVIGGLRQTHARISYLDFACGTGRVLSFIENMVDDSTGVEISEAMLALAGEKVRRSTLIHSDITSDDSLLENRYDLITCFRFILNAEPQLREEALSRLVACLRDSTSRIVFNNHAHLWSYKVVTWPSACASRRIHSDTSSRNFLTHAEVERMATRLGLVIERRVGYGFFSAKALRLTTYGGLLALEHRLAGLRGLQNIGSNQLYVARLAQ